MADPVFKYIATNTFGLSGYSPTFLDIDSDGDSDVFSGAGENTLFFRNTGTISNPIFSAAVLNPFGLSAGGGSPAFADIDHDGDLDAFVGSEAGKTLFFRNIGTASIPLFAAPQTNQFGLIDVGSFAQPTFVDIDGDGDLDAYVGNYYGGKFFRNIGTVSNPSFAAPEAGLGGSVTPSFVDIDGDGDFDAFVDISKDYYYGYGGYTFFYRNIGTTNNPVFYPDSIHPFGLKDEYFTGLGVTFADIDGDNDFDAFLHTSLFFENVDEGYSPHFSSKATFDLNVDHFPNVSFVDIDGDGDLNAFAGHTYLSTGGYEDDGDTLFFENTGSVTSPAFAAAIVNPFGLTDAGNYAYPTFVDIDGDNDLDAFIGNEIGNVFFYKNIGTTLNPIFSAPIINPFRFSDVGEYVNPSFVDVDSDNDLDAFMNNVFFENIGSIDNPAFATPVTNPFGLKGTSFKFLDVDNDGDSDAFNDEMHEFGIGFFRNIGTAINPMFSEELSPFSLPGTGYKGDYTSVTYVDIDRDGDVDAYITGGSDFGNDNQPWGHFRMNNHAPNVTNLTAAETYTRNTLKSD